MTSFANASGLHSNIDLPEVFKNDPAFPAMLKNQLKKIGMLADVQVTSGEVLVTWRDSVGRTPSPLVGRATHLAARASLPFAATAAVGAATHDVFGTLAVPLVYEASRWVAARSRARETDQFEAARKGPDTMLQRAVAEAQELVPQLGQEYLRAAAASGPDSPAAQQIANTLSSVMTDLAEAAGVTRALDATAVLDRAGVVAGRLHGATAAIKAGRLEHE